MNHGQITIKRIPVNQGKTIYTKRVKYCAAHGEIDLFMCDESEWQRLHAECVNQPQKNGAFCPLPKALKKAA